MIISEVLSISLDQQIVYQNGMNKTWLLSATLKNVQRDTADLVVRHHKNQPIGGEALGPNYCIL